MATELALALMVGAPVAYAQAPAGEKIEVTGTRIRSPGVISNSPVTSVLEEEIQSLQPMVVEEFFKGLPAAVPAIGAGTNNGTGGGATIDIRGLGANRSLVLIDGRRIVPFDLSGAVDTNVIPIALLQRVDLITGGASAVYGADAIAGVANFILKKDFKGVEVASSYGRSSKRDANRTRTDLTVGAGTDNGRGNVALSFGLTQVDPLRQDARPIGLVSRSSTTGNPAGSGTAVPVTTFLPGLLQLNTTTGRFTAPVTTYNFNPDNYYQTGLDRFQTTTLAHYAINKHVDVYANLMFTRSDVSSQLAPSGSFFNDYFVPLGNPYLPAAARQQICAFEGLTAAQCAEANREVLLTLGRRFVELGPRLNDFKNTMYQWTTGSKGEIVGNWTYDAYLSQGRSDQVQTRVNWGSFSKLQQALRATSRTDCLDTSSGCVPLNIFGALGSITPEMLKFINLDAVLQQNVEQRIASASISGDLGKIKSPWAGSAISLAVGAESRKVEAGNKSDGPTQIQGEVLGTGAPLPDRQGVFKLKEAFTEFYVPLIQDKPFLRSLALEAAYRNSKFTTSSSDSYGTWKFGGEWEPVRDLRIRAMKQRATRAPNVDELFAPLITGLDNLAVDPCQGTRINAAQANTPGTLSNLCRLTGVPVSRIGSLSEPSAGQINVLTGGNPALGPEEADTKTLGFVFRPSMVKGLTLSLDYYKIDVHGAVSNPSSSDILDDCYTAARNPAFVLNNACANVFRNPNNGTFNGTAARGVVLALSNLGFISTSGYDLNANYSLGLNRMGRLDIGISVNQVKSYDYQATPASIKRNCLGYYSIACAAVSAGEGPIFKTKWNQRTSWTVSNFAFSYNWRRISAVVEEPGGTNFLPAYASIDAYDYLDLAAVWNATKNIRLTLTVLNAANKKPPEVGNTIGSTSANSGNTFPQSYDTIGRYYTLGAVVKF